MTYGRRIRPLAGLAFLIGFVLLATPAARAATFTVTTIDTTSDGTCDNHCSLADAITAANAAPGADRIEFAVAGPGVGRITLTSLLPAIAGDLEIDGFTQPGSQPNTAMYGPLDAVPLIEIDADAVTAGLQISGPRVRIQGLVIHAGVSAIAIADASAADVVIAGNFLGTSADGTAAGVGQFGIFAAFTPGLTIGGSQASERNLISGNTGAGIGVGHPDSTPARLLVRGNLIGTDVTGAQPLGNGGPGIIVSGAIDATIYLNFIAYNAGPGVAVLGPLTSTGAGVEILDTTIVDNGGLGIDLEDDGRTPNDADDSDTGANARLNFPAIGRVALDVPSGRLFLRATVQAAPNTLYRLELHRASASRPHGADTIGRLFETLVTTDASGRASIASSHGMTGLAVGDAVSATLTDANHGYTSEISDTALVTLAGPSISGYVTRDGGLPIANVAVQLSGALSQSARTDGVGYFLLPDLTPGGDYTVTPLTIGYTFTPASLAFTNVTADATADFSAAVLPVSYTVDVTNDTSLAGCLPGDCSLREAIEEANAHPGPDTIRFAIPGEGPHVIGLHDVLPDLQDGLIIDGYTQPGALPNTQATGGLDTVLRIAIVPGVAFYPGAPAAVITGNRVTVRGLSVSGFDLGLSVFGNPMTEPMTAIVIEGNYIGVLPDGGTTSPNSGAGIVAIGAFGLRVGGSTPAARNLISGHFDTGILVMPINPAGPSTVVIRGNLIGTDATGLQARPNVYGIDLRTGGVPHEIVHIGGPGTHDGNVISGNDIGLSVGAYSSPEEDSADHLIEGNTIGLAADGVTPLGNAYEGIDLCGEMRLTVRRNTVAHNEGSGLVFCGAPTPGGAGVEITENRIYGNTGFAIDLDRDGRTANDADDSDTGPNDLQNFPVLTDALEQLTGVALSGTLTSRPNRAYRVELFTTGGLPGVGDQAREFLTSVAVTTDENGVAAFATILPGAFPMTEQFVATATDIVAKMTSEVSDSLAMSLLPRTDLSGLITFNGAPLPNVRVSLTGTRTATIQTGGDGRYLFTALPAGASYRVTPSADGFLFTPPDAAFDSLTAGATADFTARAVTYTRYLTEGAAGAFWETSISLLNASSVATMAEVAFLLPDGHRETVSVPLTGPGHAEIDPATIPALNGATFSTVVTADVPLVASRTMRWGTQRELGAHAEQALNEPRTSWYFAEGATGCFDLFYQLVNPGATPADVEVTFVRRAPAAPVVARYTVGPFARHTIRANVEEGLAAAEVSARVAVTNGQPIVAERAMYANCYGATWRGGHDAVGSPAPAQEWYFAEGATNSFFDLYLLVANFETQAAQVEVEYLFADGSRLVKPHTVAAGSRETIDVAGESPLLAQAVVSAIVRSRNGVPVVAERSQWWPRGGWYEGHVSAGVTQAGVEWQLAGAQIGGPHDVSGYLLIANTGDTAGRAQVRAVFADGTTAALAEPIALAPRSRATLDLADAFPQAQGRPFGLIVESLGTPAAPTPAAIAVELSSYNDTHGADGARFWGAGTNIVATRVR